MPVRKVESHELVIANKGKIALERGPLVFCAEEVDNPAGVLNWAYTEICEIFLVPKELPDFRRSYPSASGRPAYNSMERWWRGSGTG